jgi:hypothetical protein
VTSPQVVDLHDGGTLVAADTAALLPSAALAGAQVRSAAEQVARWPEFDRPRALVVVGGTAAIDAALLTALIGDQSPAPVVASTSLPGWVGPLDIVVVLACAVDDRPSAEAAAQATRRGARVVVRASADGPVAGAAGSALLEPQVSVPEALAGAARLTVLAAVAAAAGLYPRPDFAAAADQLDAMAMACHPSSEFFVNPALTLAEHLAAGTPLLIGTDPVADALGAHACRSLAGLAGCAAASLTSAQAAASPPVLARAATRGGGPAAGGSPDIFWDPYDDAADEGQQISIVLVVGPSAQSPAGPLTGSGLLPTEGSPFFSPIGAPVSPLVAALEAAVPRAMRIGPEELPSSAATDSELPAGPPGLRQRDAFTWTVSMLSRIDFAAVYLGLLTRARPPADSPDGLGRSGRAAQHLPLPGGRAQWSDGESGSWS